MRNRYAHALAFTLAAAMTACSHAASQTAVSPGVSGEPNNVVVHSANAIPASIAVDMPGMAMRPDLYPLQRTSKDTYTASSVRFSMAGQWRVRILGASHAAVGTLLIDVR